MGGGSEGRLMSDETLEVEGLDGWVGGLRDA